MWQADIRCGGLCREGKLRRIQGHEWRTQRICRSLSCRSDGVVREDDPLAQRRRIAFDALLTYPLLVLDRGSNARSVVDKEIAGSRRVPNITMELGSIEVIRKVVALDFGVSIVPCVAIRSDVESGRVYEFDVLKSVECRMLGVVCPRTGVM